MAAFTIASRVAETNATSPIIDRDVADHHHVDRDAVGVLDLGRGTSAAGRPASAVVRLAVQQAAQFTFLSTGQPGDLARRLRVALDERQRLQHRVVQMGGQFGPLLRPDAFAPLVGQARDGAHPPRPGDQRDAGRGDDHGDEAVAHRADVGADEHERPRRGSPAPRRPSTRRRPLRSAVRDSNEVRDRRHHRARSTSPDCRQISAPPSTPRMNGMNERPSGNRTDHDRQPDDRGTRPRRRTWRPHRPRAAGRARLLGQHDPVRAVEHDAQATGGAQQDEDDPDRPDRDAEVIGDAAADAAEQLTATLQ